MSKRIVYRLVWIPSVILFAILLASFSRPSGGSSAPGQLKLYAANDKSLTIKYPDNWAPGETGEHGVKSVIRFDADQYTALTVSSDLMGSLMADIDKTPAGLGGMMPGGNAGGRTPLEKLHLAKGAELQTGKLYAEYAEGNTTTEQIAGTDAFVTNFTYKEMEVSGLKEMVGVRATLLSGDRRIQMIGHCPKESEKEIITIFNKMMSSLHLSQAGG